MNEDNKEGVYLTSKRFITLGNKSEDKVEVIEGLNLGEIVVLEGAYSVEDSQRVKLRTRMDKKNKEFFFQAGQLIIRLLFMF